MSRLLTSTYILTPELEELLEKLRRITAQDLRLTNEKKPTATEERSQNGTSQQAESDETSTTAQEEGGETFRAPAPRAVQHTRSRGPPPNVDMSTVNDSDLHEAASLALYEKIALEDAAHSEDM